MATDIMGKLARAILDALLAGQTDPATLAELARGRMKANRAELEQALVGTLKPHHRFMLTEHLVLIDTLEEAITRATQEIETRVGPPDAGGPSAVSSEEDGLPTEKQTSEEQEDPLPLDWMEAVKLVDTIPGINVRVAQGISTEIGTDMNRFKTARHLASWVGMVRCITRLNIPGAARENSKGCSWVNDLPRIERRREQEHVTESGRKREDAYGNVPQDPHNMVRARLLKF